MGFLDTSLIVIIVASGAVLALIHAGLLSQVFEVDILLDDNLVLASYCTGDPQVIARTVHNRALEGNPVNNIIADMQGMLKQSCFTIVSNVLIETLSMLEGSPYASFYKCSSLYCIAHVLLARDSLLRVELYALQSLYMLPLLAFVLGLLVGGLPFVIGGRGFSLGAIRLAVALSSTIAASNVIHAVFLLLAPSVRGFIIVAGLLASLVALVAIALTLPFYLCRLARSFLENNTCSSIVSIRILAVVFTGVFSLIGLLTFGLSAFAQLPLISINTVYSGLSVELLLPSIVGIELVLAILVPLAILQLWGSMPVETLVFVGLLMVFTSATSISIAVHAVNEQVVVIPIILAAAYSIIVVGKLFDDYPDLREDRSR